MTPAPTAGLRGRRVFDTFEPAVPDGSKPRVDHGRSRQPVRPAVLSTLAVPDADSSRAEADLLATMDEVGRPDAVREVCRGLLSQGIALAD
jgi:hypothetical protein